MTEMVLCEHVLLRVNLKDKHLSMSSELILLSVSLQTWKRFHAVHVLTRVLIVFPAIFEICLHINKRHKFSVVCFFESENDYYVWRKWCSVMYDHSLFLVLTLFFSVRPSFLQWPLCWKMITLFGELAYRGDLRQKKWSFIGDPAMGLRALNTASMADVTLWRYAQFTKSWHIRNKPYLWGSSLVLLIMV